MSPEERDRFLHALTTMSQRLLDEGNIKIAPNRVDTDMGSDEDSQPLNEMSQAIASKRNVNRTRLLKLVAAALHRLKQFPDDFGYCDECDDPLPARRLEVMPYARYCVGCQSTLEDPLHTRRKHLTDYD